jgi:hypothetical protein
MHSIKVEYPSDTSCERHDVPEKTESNIKN